jgi:hypothetical protein
MILEKHITTKDNDALIKDRMSAYFSQLGYKLKKSDTALVFQRGSALGTWLAFSPMEWKVETMIEIKREPDNRSTVSVVFLIFSHGQLVTSYERKFWETELEGAERALVSGEFAYGESIKLANDAINQNLLSYLVLGIISLTCGFIGLFFFNSMAAAFGLMVAGLVVWLVILRLIQKRKIKK